MDGQDVQDEFRLMIELMRSCESFVFQFRRIAKIDQWDDLNSRNDDHPVNSVYRVYPCSVRRLCRVLAMVMPGLLMDRCLEGQNT